MKKRVIDSWTPKARLCPLGNGRFVLNALDGIACTLTGAHHYAGNITHPRQGFREMGVLEVAQGGAIESHEKKRDFNLEASSK